MTTLQAIAQAVSETIAEGVRLDFLNADSSWEEIAEYARCSVPEVLRPKKPSTASDRAVYALVEAEIVTQAQDMRPL